MKEEVTGPLSEKSAGLGSFVDRIRVFFALTWASTRHPFLPICVLGVGRYRGYGLCKPWHNVGAT